MQFWGAELIYDVYFDITLFVLREFKMAATKSPNLEYVN